MTTAPIHVLLLDDGELDGVAGLLDELEIPFTRLRGGEIEVELPPPTGLLVTTPRRAEVARRGSPPGAKPGRPVRIIVVDEDSKSMRRMLRQMGFHLLVRRPTHPEVWRLLIRRAVYQGAERRVAARVPAGSKVELSSRTLTGSAVLIDISNRGCRLMVGEELPEGTSLAVAIPDPQGDGDAAVVSGRILRITCESGLDGETTHTAVMLFDDAMPTAVQLHLARLLNQWATGPSSFSDHREQPWVLPPRRSSEQRGFTLDDETDPAICANVDVELRMASGVEGADERRESPRGAFEGQVVATSEIRAETRVLLGRDLSAGGMRVERLPDVGVGDRLTLALYGPSQQEPFRLRATVIRDDGEEGFALRFENVSEGVAEELEKMVACLPDVESLENGEAASMGSVISEILPETDP